MTNADQSTSRNATQSTAVRPPPGPAGPAGTVPPRTPRTAARRTARQPARRPPPRPIGDPPGCRLVTALPDPDPDPDLTEYPLAVLADWIVADLKKQARAAAPEPAAPAAPELSDEPAGQLAFSD